MGQAAAGLCLGLGAAGSALGIMAAGMSAAGCWVRDAKAGRPLNFKYIVLMAMPLSQTLYAMIVMNAISRVAMHQAYNADRMSMILLGAGLGCGLAQLFSALAQGRIGAAACRTLSESGGQGMAFLIIAMGIAETVGIFGFVFAMGLARMCIP
jgi:V/A-type H+-transporting ATPase subunit K